MQATPYLMFNGNCKAAFKFYEQVLGGKIEAMTTFGESPAAGDMPPERRDMVIHASLRAGDLALMASDSPPELFEKPQGLYVSLNVESTAEAERIYDAFAEGGTVKMPLEETFWTARFAMLVDRFGTPWMISCDKAS